jgi:hypothetical protein
MTLDEFVSTQQRLIADSGLDGFLPTLWIETPRRLTVNVLTEIQNDSQVETTAREWALRSAGKYNYYLAFRLDVSHIKFIAQIDCVTSERVVAVVA